MDCLKCKGRVQVKEHAETDVLYACLNEACEMYGVVVQTEPIQSKE